MAKSLGTASKERALQGDGAPLVLIFALPWSCVMHDNHRHVPARTKWGLRLIDSPEYRLKKAAAVAHLLAKRPREKMVGALALFAKCYFPDKRKRDAGNYRKLVTDAMSGIVYADDSQLVRETWEFGGIDTSLPRIEVTVGAVHAFTPNE